MNAIQPAAHVRAVTGFQGSKAGTRSIVSFARNRCLLWLLVRFLPLVILTILGVNPAYADGVSTKITSGTSQTGTITSGTDSYSFTVPPGGGSFVVTAAETGVHDTNFVPQLDLVAPGNKGAGGNSHHYYTRLWGNNAPEGNWTIKVSRADGYTTGGSYSLALLQLPVNAGTTMSAGSPHSGSSTRGDVDVLTFSGVSGHTETLTLTPTGDTGFVPEVSIFTPTGGFASGMSCATGCSEDVSITSGGTWVFLVSKLHGSDVTGAYTLSINEKN
jgi:hypothetical protein